MTKKELEVLNKIKKTCINEVNCENCKYHDEMWRCRFNRGYPADWIIEEE